MSKEIKIAGSISFGGKRLNVYGDLAQNQKRRKIMLRRDLIKNKIYGSIFIILGALTIPIEWDATFFLFALMVGILLFVSRENCIMD